MSYSMCTYNTGPHPVLPDVIKSDSGRPGRPINTSFETKPEKKNAERSSMWYNAGNAGREYAH